MKGLSLVLCLTVLMVPSLHAGTITLTSSGGSQFAMASGVALPSGCAVRIGTFTLPAESRDATLSATTDLNQLKAWFKPLAEGVTNAGSPAQLGGSGSMLRTNDFPTAGDTFGTISDINAGYMAPGTQLYVWIFDTANPQDASQFGLFTAGTWTAPPALGNQSLSTAVAVQALQGTTGGSQLRLSPIASNYSNWTWKRFSPGTTAASLQFTADSDGDGLQNLAEYAWGLNPSSRDQTQASLAAPSGADNATFTFKNPRTLPDVQVLAERSEDLTTWNEVASSVIATDASFETRRCTAPAGSHWFYRVKFLSVTPP